MTSRNSGKKQGEERKTVGKKKQPRQTAETITPYAAALFAVRSRLKELKIREAYLDDVLAKMTVLSRLGAEMRNKKEEECYALLRRDMAEKTLPISEIEEFEKAFRKASNKMSESTHEILNDREKIKEELSDIRKRIIALNAIKDSIV